MRASQWMAAMAILVTSAGQAAAQEPLEPLLSVIVEGEVVNRAGQDVGSFEGVLDIVSFELNEDGQLVANGLLSGDVLNPAGRVRRALTDVAVTLDVTEIIGEEVEGVCQILNLTLGPLDLNVLGLIVELDEVNLDISADPAGGLLGQLLCALADGLGISLIELLGDITGLLGDLLEAGLLDDVLDLLNSIGSIEL